MIVTQPLQSELLQDLREHVLALAESHNKISTERDTLYKEINELRLMHNDLQKEQNRLRKINNALENDYQALLIKINTISGIISCRPLA